MILKRVVSAALLLVFLFQAVNKLVIVADYYNNKDYIARVLCENRSKPKMHCNGQCHLKKQLEKEDRGERVPLNLQKDQHEIQLFSEKNNELHFLPVLITCSSVAPCTAPVSDQHLLSIFHPPRV